MSTSPVRKRRRVDITAAQKRDLCVYKAEHPKVTQTDIISHFSKEWGVTIGRSTVSEILKDKSKWLSVSKDSGDVLRNKSAKHTTLETALYTWFDNARSQSLCISDDMLISKAKKFGEDLAVTDFQYSRGWLSRFKKRHGIRMFKSHGEAGSAQASVVQNGREQLRDELRDWSPKDVYNMDETGLFYRLEPTATLATAAVPGKKKSKDRLTVALCSNADGTDMLKPLVIGKAAKPRCFNGGFDPSVYADYFNNKTAWMTTSIFQTWLSKLDRQMRLNKRKIMLLLDNATSHGDRDMKLTNITVKHLPPNTTAHIQPMDAGIIRNFKLYYHRLLTNHFMECLDNDQPMAINVRFALRFISQAWGFVKPQTIVNCWRHVQIMPTTTALPDEAEDDLPLTQLTELLSKLPVDLPIMSADAYVDIDKVTETGEALSDSEIIHMVRPESDPPQPESEEDEAPISPRKITASMAISSINDTITFLEGHPELAKKHLQPLLETLTDIKQLSINTARQTSMLDFFMK